MEKIFQHLERCGVKATISQVKKVAASLNLQVDFDQLTREELNRLTQALRQDNQRSTAGKGFVPKTRDGNGNGKASAEDQPTDLTPISDTATRDANLHVASVLRDTLAGRRALVDHLANQRESVTEYVSEQVADILDPASIDQEIAHKILQKLEGHQYESPFDLVDVTAELVPSHQRLHRASGFSARLAASSG